MDGEGIDLANIMIPNALPECGLEGRCYIWCGKCSMQCPDCCAEQGSCTRSGLARFNILLCCLYQASIAHDERAPGKTRNTAKLTRNALEDKSSYALGKTCFCCRIQGYTNDVRGQAVRPSCEAAAAI